MIVVGLVVDVVVVGLVITILGAATAMGDDTGEDEKGEGEGIHGESGTEGGRDENAAAGAAAGRKEGEVIVGEEETTVAVL